MLNSDEGTADGYMSDSQDPTVYEEEKRGDFYYWKPPDLIKPRHLTPGEKIATERHYDEQIEKALIRDDLCWELECKLRARVWVLEVQYDMKGSKAELGKHAVVNTSDFTGPVPGFCMLHIGTGPAHLAERVYWTRTLMQWGFKPERWAVIFTDGTKQGGSCLEIDPKQETPTIIEEFNGEG